MIKKILKILAIAIVLLITLPLIIGQILRLTASVELPPGELVDVGGYKLHINCVSPEGKADDQLPTVVIEAGAGGSSPGYHWIQDGVSKTTKVCVYDRAGLGWSEESNLPRDAKTINTALHRLLEKTGVKRPFVFAGHSIAGLYMRDYVERYPDDVLGIVFMDASHPEQNEKFALTESQKDEQESEVNSQMFLVKLLTKLGVLEVYNPMLLGDFNTYPENIRSQLEYLYKQTRTFDTLLLEIEDFEKAADQAAKNTSLGDRPVVVISATEEIPADALPEGVSAEKFQDTFIDLHKELVALSTKGEHIKIKSAGHVSLVTNKENAAKVVPHIINVVKESAEKPEKSDSDKENTETKEEAK